ncbi:hypothetical protein [Acidithiobacillus ferriphilus]|nr:hypothetical protein [Acidithiobacillus ferriphilus]WCE95273.1 hypothetical protein PJU76_01990 [Acidithiobacillus ferriphilus]
MTPRKNAIKTDLFAADFHQQKLDHGSRSGRVARQFARHWAGSKAIAALQ